MHELSGILTFIVRTVDFVWDVVLFVSDSRKLASMWTGSDKLVAVPAEAKILSPAAQRALAEAERRNQFLYLPASNAGPAPATRTLTKSVAISGSD